MNIIGIDPSLTATGVAGFGGTLHTIKTKPADKDERLATIFYAIDDEAFASATAPGHTRAVIEDLPKQAMGAGITGMVQGVVRLALIHHGVPYIKIPPATLKKFATGKGNADKAAMRVAWREYSGEDNADDNQVDAAFLRLIGQYISGQDVALPQEQLAAVAAYQNGFDL